MGRTVVELEEALQESEERRRELEREVEEVLFEVHDLREGDGGKEGGGLKEEKLEECLGELIYEMEEGQKKCGDLERETADLRSKIVLLQAEVTGGKAVKLGLQQQIKQANVVISELKTSSPVTAHLDPQPPVSPLPATLPSSDLISSLRSQLRSRDETIATLNRKHTREKSALQTKILGLEKAVQDKGKQAGAGRFNAPSPAKRRRNASSDPARNEVSSRGRAPSSVRSSSQHFDLDQLEKIRAHVDKTMSRVSLILKQFAEVESKRGGKKPDPSMAGVKKSLLASQHDLAVSKQMICEMDGSSGIVTKTRSSPLRVTSRRDASPANRGKNHKAPVPPISLSELRMRSPRLQLSPKQLTHAPLTARVPSSYSQRSEAGSSKAAKQRAAHDYTAPRRTASGVALSPRPKRTGDNNS